MIFSAFSGTIKQMTCFSIQKTLLLTALAGAFLWVVSLTLAGFFFGNLPWVKQNLTLVILGIIAVSMLPLLVGWIRHHQDRN